MNLILIEAHEASGDGFVSLRGARADHLRSVLQATPGSTIRVGMVDGPVGTAIVLAAGAADVSLQCVFNGGVPERPGVDLLLALPRPKVLKRLWAQLASLGTSRILLTNAARVERSYFDTHVLEPGFYRPLLIEGLQQARDTWIPNVSVHRQLKVLLEDELGPASDHERIYADPWAGRSVGATLSTRTTPRVLLAVGPEGGWTDYERQMLARHGFEAVTMGRRTLRSDTACVALLTLVHAALNERSGLSS